MQDGPIHYKLYLLKLTMAVDNSVFRKGAFNVHINLLCMRLCRPSIPSNRHTSLSTTIVNDSPVKANTESEGTI